MKNYLVLNTVPQSPKHFYLLMTNLLGQKTSYNLTSEFVNIVSTYNNIGIFNSAYGYFYVTKNKKFSKLFYSSYFLCINHVHKLKNS
jgi:hypothetical protein